MNSRRRSMEMVVWGALGLTIAGIAWVYFLAGPGGRSDALPVYGRVPDFTLTNQFGQKVSLRDLEGRIWLADIIFTRCAGPCPKLSRVMEALAARLGDVEGLRMVSLTADPAFDEPEVLARYGKRFGAEAGQWDFLTGGKQALYELASSGLKLAVLEKDPGEQENVNDLFIHSTVFTLVDGRGQLRGFYEALEPGTEDVIVAAVRALAKEEL